MDSNVVSVTLGRDLGGNNTGDDFDLWARFVTDRLPSRVSFDVDVDMEPEGQASSDRIDGDEGQRQAVRDAIEALWAEWCEQPAS